MYVAEYATDLIYPLYLYKHNVSIDDVEEYFQEQAELHPHVIFFFVDRIKDVD